MVVSRPILPHFRAWKAPDSCLRCSGYVAFMRKIFGTGNIFRLAALVAATALILGSVPANSAPLSAKPDSSKGSQVSSGKNNKDSKPGNGNGSSSTTSEEVGSTAPGNSGNSNRPDNSGNGAASAGNSNSGKSGKTSGKGSNGKTNAKSATKTYIIVFKPAANLDEGIRAIGALKGSVGRKFGNALNGVTATLNEKQFAALSKNPNISFIEEDGPVALIEPLSVTTQPSAPWGLDRIDQQSGRDGNYTYSVSGTSVTAYVIDTGILSSHQSFGGRVGSGYSAIAGGTEDCNGHGTHVAGTIGSSGYGVAKNVQLIPVRVLDCSGSGTISGVIAGLDWVAAQNVSGARVANMSLGGGASSALDSAVNGLISKGVSVVVAAGNSSADACKSSPARVPAAITVAASTINDALASYSNRGSCVDIIAPGSSILSAWHTSSTATNTISGTSMAAPHVAGTIALLLQQFGIATPAQLDERLKMKATRNVFSSLPSGTPNLFLYTDPLNSITSAPADEVVTNPTKPGKGGGKTKTRKS